MLLSAVAALLLSGCAVPTHFHDEKAAALATQLQADFAAYRADQSSLYSTMAANAAAFEAEEDALLARFQRSSETALATATPLLDEASFKKRHASAVERLTILNVTVLEAARSDLEKVGTVKAGLKDVKGVIASIEADIASAKMRAAAWNKMIATFQDAIAKLPDNLDALGSPDIGALSIDTAFDQIKSDKAVDPETLLQELTPVPEDLKQALKTELADAPGIAVRILELGLELAELKRQGLERELSVSAQRDQAYRDFWMTSIIAGQLLSDAGQSFEESSQSIVTPVLEKKLALKRPVTSDQAEDVVLAQSTIFNELNPLRYTVSAESLIAYQEALLDVRLARIEHQASIARSEIGDQAWQALIASGLDGLVAYHAGGVTKEDIANIIRLAQSIALYLIAA